MNNNLHEIVSKMKFGHVLIIYKKDHYPARWMIENGNIYCQSAIIGPDFVLKKDYSLKKFIRFINRMQRNGFILQPVKKSEINTKIDFNNVIFS